MGRVRLIWLIRRFRNHLKIIVGSANTSQYGWISTNYPLLDLTSEKSFAALLKPGSVCNFMAEHVWEHLSPEDVAKANHNCLTFLKRGGVLRIAVPDGFHPDPDYISQVKPGGYGPGADDHKIMFDYKMLSAMLEKTGFQVRLLEWFDEDGNFHAENWDDENGMIKRSTRFDPRNSVNPTQYTSLIVDAVKP